MESRGVVPLCPVQTDSEFVICEDLDAEDVDEDLQLEINPDFD